jgi:D-amino-acid dehydrogenase
MASGGGAEAPSVIVVGAGVVGVATAYALARRGARVIIVDREQQPGRGTSFANGAQLSYLYTDALANPGILKRVLGLLLGLEPAFRLKPSLDPAYLWWLLQFLRNATPGRFRANTLAGLELGLESRAAMAALLAEHPFEFGHSESGKLHLYDSSAGLAEAAKLVELKRQHGGEQEILGTEELLALEPALRNRTVLPVGAVYTPQDAVGDPFRFCVGLLDLLVRSFGVVARLGATVTDLQLRNGQAIVRVNDGETLTADELVVCAGVESGRWLVPYGLGSSLQPMKGYSFTAPLGVDCPVSSITDVARKVVFCQLQGRVRVAGFAELGTADRTVSAKRFAYLLTTARDILPLAADYAATGEAWTGLRPMTPSSLPIVRRVRPGLSVNIGHGMLGWTFAMGSAERLANAVLGMPVAGQQRA